MVLRGEVYKPTEEVCNREIPCVPIIPVKHEVSCRSTVEEVNESHPRGPIAVESIPVVVSRAGLADPS